VATYADFLKQQGATEEDIKILDTAVTRKAFDALNKTIADIHAKAQAAETKVGEYQDWYEKVAEPTAQKYMQERDIARANQAASDAQLKSLQESGLLKVAAADPQPVEDPKSPVDLSKYVTADTLMQVAEREGDAIAIAQDIAFEHQTLFPGKPLNFRELRKTAVANRRAVEAEWMEKYGVTAAREAKAKAEVAADHKRIADEAVLEYKKSVSTSNPNLVVPGPSSSPFTGRVPSRVDKDATPPWQKSESDLANQRLAKVLGKHPELLQ
jgi:hypothetical protein